MRIKHLFVVVANAIRKIYYFNTIKKVVIYITSKPDPEVGFKRILFLNCDLYSSEGQKENLFKEQNYDEQKVNEF